ncbi:unnamed protein product [Moneuplotes crassus]|uniref:Peptidase A1 domain-containing protein n=1 Tax=Euplotes crassus TaxID=5936 RepID=A0AAD1UDQ3_EUPCR|nr:unnamed protein product [Moneuplotes crassus]
MKITILLIALLAFSYAYRVDLKSQKLDKSFVINKQDALNKGNYKAVSTAELDSYMKEGRSPMTIELPKQANSDNPRIHIDNLQNVLYYGQSAVGSRGEVFDVTFDTGSGWIYISEVGCTTCTDSKKLFDPKTSTTYKSTGVRKELSYGLGYVAGPISYDTFALEGQKGTTMKFVLAQEGKDNEGYTPNGIVGMTPVGEDADLYLTKLYEAGIIDGEEFTVYIGKEGIDESWLEFGINKDDQSQVTWVNLKPMKGYPLYYWSADFDSLSVGKQKLNLRYESTIWDTGTSLLGFNSRDLQTIIRSIAGSKQIYNIQDQLFAVECNSESQISQFDDIEFVFNGHPISIPSSEYTEFARDEQSGRGFCIFDLFDIDMPAALLGDTFLRGQKIIHDQAGLRLGMFPQRTYSEPTYGEMVQTYLPIVGVATVALVVLNKFFDF